MVDKNISGAVVGPVFHFNSNFTYLNLKFDFLWATQTETGNQEVLPNYFFTKLPFYQITSLNKAIKWFFLKASFNCYLIFGRNMFLKKFILIYLT